MAQIIDPGDYRAKSIGAELGKSSKKGTDQITIRFSLLDFPQQTIDYRGYFSEAAFDITMRQLRAAGFKGDNLADLSSLAEEVSPEVVLVVEHEDYQGKTYARVKFINDPTVQVSRALDAGEAKAFAARMRGRIVAFDKSTSAETGSPAPAKTAAPVGRVAPKASTKPMPVKREPPAQPEVPQEVLDQQGEEIPF